MIDLPNYWAEIQAELGLLNGINGPGHPCLCGDSITRYMQTPTWQGVGSRNSAFYPMAFAGARIEDLIQYADPIWYAVRPSGCILMIGTNNIIQESGLGTTFLDNLGVIIPAIRQYLPNADRIALATVPPMDPGLYPPATTLLPVLQGINAVIRQGAAAEKINCLDVYAAIANPQGFAPSGMTDDGIHPSRIGFGIIKPLYDAQIDAWGL